MKCQNCGEVGEAAARFCWSCGAPFSTVGDERRVATVLFADLVGFTSLSESLDPERVKSLIDRAFERLVNDVHSFGGRVDKIVGDAIMALFGAPVAHEDDPERAVRAGLRMHETLAAFSEEAGIGIRMRVGVNTGEVLVGALRAGGDYTAMGDVVNTASRLQTSAAPGEVLVGPTTHQSTSTSILYESRGSVVVRGRDEAIEVFAAIKTTEAPGFRRRRLTPMVGRESELGMVGEALRLAVRHERPTVILLMGEAGVGKTRLANEVLPLVAELDPQVMMLSGRCVPYGEANPWWPIADALRELVDVGADDSLDVAHAKTADVVARSVPEPEEALTVSNGLLHVMGYDSPIRDLEPEKARAVAISALMTMIERRSPDRPVVVRLADLHWASTSVFTFIDALLDRVSRRSFIVVATARPSLLDRWTPPASKGNSVVLQLDPLGAEAAGRLLDVLVDRPIPDDIRSVLIERGGGNPFFLEELATLVEADSDLSSLAALELPDTLRGLVAARLDRLSADQQHVVEDASVWGPSGPTVALDQIARAIRSVPDVTEEIRALVDNDVFTLDGHEWSFRSDLVREVAYKRITKSERLDRHLGIARYMAAIKPGRFVDDMVVDIVARHYCEAARLAADIGAPPGATRLDREALDWLAESARRARDAGAWSHATRMYDDALEVIERVEPAPAVEREMLGLRLGRSQALLEQWQMPEARADAEFVRSVAESAGDEQIEVTALARLGEIATRDNDLDLARELLADARRRSEAMGDRRQLAETLRHIAMGELFSGHLPEAESAVLESLGVFREVADRRGEAWALQTLAWIAFTQGQLDRAEARLLESESAFGEMSDSAGRNWALGLLAYVRFAQGRFDDARHLGEQVLVEAEHRGDRWGQAMVLVVLASVDLWEGRTRLATSLAERAVDLLRHLNEPVGLELAVATAGRALLMTGDVEGGWELIAEAATLSETGSAFQPDQALMWNVLTQMGRSAEIDADHLGGLPDAAAEPGLGDTPAVLALAHLQRGDVDGALRRLPHSGGEPERPFASAVRALVAAARGDVDAVRSAAEATNLAGASYLDRLYALVALALASPGEASDHAVAAHDLAHSTEDVFAILLADTLSAAVGGARSADAMATMRRRWAAAGGNIAGWSTIIDAALSATIV